MNPLQNTVIDKYQKVFGTIFNSTPTTFIFLICILFIPISGNTESGEKIFKDLCAICHSTSDNVVMGPGLKGISDRRSEEWLIKWIKNSQELIDAKDQYALDMFEKYKKIPMPPFPQLSDEDIKNVIKYINESPSIATVAAAAPEKPVVSISEGANSGHNSILMYIIIGCCAVLGASWMYYGKRLKKQLNEIGYYSDPHSIPNYTLYFLIYLLVAAGIVYFLTGILAKKSGMIDTLMFIVLPYLSLVVLLIGSIYRYRNRGFQVSSLSSQFLEGRKLFWGSLPFHWGLLFLFFGHLISFIFPETVLAWNGNPVRLLILEFSSFAFGLLVLVGLLLLVKRRLSEKKLLVVANKMDLVVYTVLIVQVLSGLGVAFFVRWGSSWFSSVLTPYLRSIFSFKPEINAMVEMPWLVQIHVISAFAIIGIIPFTRFVHFLVAPLDYAWRKYQLVIWNWNPKVIRMSRKYNFGKKPRNH